jgi:hypothetical protein
MSGEAVISLANYEIDVDEYNSRAIDRNFYDVYVL